MISLIPHEFSQSREIVCVYVCVCVCVCVCVINGFFDSVQIGQDSSLLASYMYQAMPSPLLALIHSITLAAKQPFCNILRSFKVRRACFYGYRRFFAFLLHC